MANFAILRTGKIKSAASVRGMLKHNFRDIDTPNADDEKTADNEHLAAVSVKDGMRRYRELMPTKIRKNGVHLIDYMITTSPEASKEANAAALQEGYDWVAEIYGKDKIVMASKHNDESTPHIHILVAPIDEKGKLNAYKFIGGLRHRMSEIQDEFHERLKAKGIKLDRGLRGSKVKHQTISEWAKKKAEAERITWNGLIKKVNEQRTPQEIGKTMFVPKYETQEKADIRTLTSITEEAVNAKTLADEANTKLAEREKIIVESNEHTRVGKKLFEAIETGNKKGIDKFAELAKAKVNAVIESKKPKGFVVHVKRSDLVGRNRSRGHDDDLSR